MESLFTPMKKANAIKHVYTAFLDYYNLAKDCLCFLLPTYEVVALPEDVAAACARFENALATKGGADGVVSGTSLAAVASRKLVRTVEYEYLNLDAEAFNDFMCLALMGIECKSLDEMREYFNGGLENVPEDEFYDAAFRIDMSLMVMKEDLFDTVAKHINREGDSFRYYGAFGLEGDASLEEMDDVPCS